MLRNIPLLASLLYLACTTTEQSFSDRVSIDPKPEDRELPTLRTEQHVFQSEGGKARVEWFFCGHAKKASNVLVLNVSDETFDKETVCQTLVVGEILQNGYNVIAVNRPGYGSSTGHDSFGDNGTISSLEGVVGQIRGLGNDLVGLWAFGDASITGFGLAKRIPLKYLIVGNGIYDWDQTLRECKDDSLLQRMKTEQGVRGAQFAENRSIAWDFVGLPNSIFLYHSSLNPEVATSQAANFKNSLAMGEFKAELYVLDDEGKLIREPYHRGVLGKIFSRIQQERP